MRSPLLALVVLCVGALLDPCPAPAQDATTYALAQLVERAQQHSSEVAESQWRLEGARAQVAKARAAYLLPRLRLESFGGLVPDAKGDLFHPPDDTLGLRDLGPFARTELEFVQPLYTFGQLANLRRAAESGAEVAAARVAEERLDVTLEVQQYYYGLLLAEDLLDLVRRLRGELEKWQARIDPDNPDVPLSGPYKLKLALIELDKRERQLEDRARLARAALAWRAGLPEEPPLQLVAGAALVPEVAAVPPLDSLYAVALRERPDWRQLRLGIAAKGALHDAARSAYYPQVFVAGGVRYAVAPGRTDQHNPFVKDDYNYLGGAVVVGLRQSFEWGLLGADVQKARAELYELRAKERTAVQGIRLDVRRAWDDFRQVEQCLAAARQARSLGREWIQVAQDEYDLDPGQLRELVSAFESYAGLEQEYREAVYEYNLGLARLERAVGLQLGLRPRGE
ncbi:MAG: TolC family protein [Gemmatimonadota bacterium]